MEKWDLRAMEREGWVQVGAEVAEALRLGRPVVALESTVISHGLPYPENVALAQDLEAIVRREQAVPATIAILGGVIHVGLTAGELDRLGQNGRPPAERRAHPDFPDPHLHLPVHKVSIRDFGWVMASKGHGATTVAATAFVAAKMGIWVFATGGIGGVHREGHVTFDISADLPALGSLNIAVVCAGAKSILDLPRTLEYLETVGVNVVGYRTQEFPSFFTRHSGLFLPSSADDPKQLAQMLHASQSIGVEAGTLVCVPIAPEFEADGAEVERAIAQALREADEKKILGKDITPFLLARIAALTGGKSLKANIELLKQNAQVAAQIAHHLAPLKLKTPAPTPLPAPVPSSAKVEVKVEGEGVGPRVEVAVFGCLALDLVALPEESLTHSSSAQNDNPTFAALTDGQSLPGTVTFKPGGVGRNVAEALARLGVKTHLVSGGGEEGDEFESLLRAHALECALPLTIIPVPGARTSVYHALLYPDGELRGAVGDMSAQDNLSPDLLRQGAHRARVSALLSALQRSSNPLVVLDANLPRETLAYLASLATKQKIPLFILGTTPHKVVKTVEILSGAKYAAVNHLELRALGEALGPRPKAHSPRRRVVLRQPPGPHLPVTALSEEMVDLAEFVRVRGGVENLIVTLGAQGVFLAAAHSSDIAHYAPFKPSAVVDVTGAGDSLAGGVIAGLSRGQSLEASVLLGLAAAREVIQSGRGLHAIGPQLLTLPTAFVSKL